jgi:hypothetical protein
MRCQSRWKQRADPADRQVHMGVLPVGLDVTDDREYTYHHSSIPAQRLCREQIADPPSIGRAFCRELGGVQSCICAKRDTPKASLTRP